MKEFDRPELAVVDGPRAAITVSENLTMSDDDFLAPFRKTAAEIQRIESFAEACQWGAFALAEHPGREDARDKLAELARLYYREGRRMRDSIPTPTASPIRRTA